jgi:esterase
MSSDLHELITDLNLDKFFLAGHSMGGKTAMRFAICWPEMIMGLLIADISPFADDNEKQFAYDQHHKILKAILDTDISETRSRSDVDRQLAVSIDSPKVRELIMKNLQRTDDKRFRWKINASSLMHNLDKIVEGLPLSGIEQEQITGFPVMFLKGENSDYLNTENFRKILKLFPAAELKVIRNAGHWLQADNPEAVIEALSDLLSH